jgi:hypothetical protein
LVINKSLDIEGPGSSQPPVTILSLSSRVFDMTNNNASVTLTHLTIQTEGLVAIARGGAILDSAAAALNLVHDDITGTAFPVARDALGGAIYQAGGDLSLSHCHVFGTAFGGNAGMGGAIFNAGGILSLADSNLFGECAGAIAAGGALYDGTASSLTASNTVFTGNLFINQSPGFGGAIYQGGGNLTLSQCVVSGAIPLEGSYANAGQAFGGGIYLAGGNATMANTTFTNCDVEGAVAQGGAIYVAGGTLTITNSTFYLNIAFSITGSGIGGGMYIAGGTVCISSNTTFASNDADGYGNVFGPYTLC